MWKGVLDGRESIETREKGAITSLPLLDTHVYQLHPGEYKGGKGPGFKKQKTTVGEVSKRRKYATGVDKLRKEGL